MEKRARASSRHARPILKNGEFISLAELVNRPAYKRASKFAGEIREPTAEEVEETPTLTDEQWAEALAARAERLRKIPVSLRLDTDILTWLKSLGPGHLSRINTILRNVMEYSRARPDAKP